MNEITRPRSFGQAGTLVEAPAEKLVFLRKVYSLFTGKANKGMRDLQAYCIRYQAQTHAYLLLLTQRYPSFSDD